MGLDGLKKVLVVPLGLNDPNVFVDVAFPGDDEELKVVYGQPSLKRTLGHCDLLLSQLESLAGSPADAFLLAMLSDANEIAT